MQGKRLHPNADGIFPYEEMVPGVYCVFKGMWYGVTPNNHHCNLAKHEVTEHEDGTITVKPSILVSNNDGQLWHGFLEKGVWREC